jgi:hypothetical protein
MAGGITGKITGNYRGKITAVNYRPGHNIRGWLPALGMRPLELVRAAAVIWGAHIAATAHGSVGKFMFSFIFLSLARILKTLWGGGDNETEKLPEFLCSSSRAI